MKETLLRLPMENANVIVVQHSLTPADWSRSKGVSSLSSRDGVIVLSTRTEQSNCTRVHYQSNCTHDYFSRLFFSYEQ